MPAAPPAPPPPVAVTPARPLHATALRPFRGPITTPLAFPPQPNIIVDPPGFAETGAVGVVGIPNGYGVPGGIADFLDSARFVPEGLLRFELHSSQPKAAASELRRYREGGVVNPGRLLHRVELVIRRSPGSAVYRVLGLEGVIGINGRSRN